MAFQSQYQTRSECDTGLHSGINHFDNFHQAYGAFLEDPTVWKISWFSQDGTQYRYVHKTKNEAWFETSEKKMCSLSKVYKETPIDSDQVFWIYQTTTLPIEDLENIRRTANQQGLSKEEYEDTLYYPACINEVLTDEEFQGKYMS